MHDSQNYHVSELDLVNKPSDPRRVVPTFDCAGWVVLDIGCGIGQTLTAPEFARCSVLFGIDVEERAIHYGKSQFPELVLAVAAAERIPFPGNHFDLAYSRVALPYTNIPLALTEIYRVTKPGGHIWLSLHDWKMERLQLEKALKDKNLRRFVDRLYVLINSIGLALFGCCFRRPWSNSVESFQTQYGMTKLLEKVGFENTAVTSQGHFLVTAVKPMTGE